MAAPEEDLTPNLTKGKYFVGSKGGGRYATVKSRDGQPDAMGSIVCDLFEDGSFVYMYECNHGVLHQLIAVGRGVLTMCAYTDDMPDGEDVLGYFLDGLFGSTSKVPQNGLFMVVDDVDQGANTKLHEIQELLRAAGIASVADLRKKSKRELDAIGLPIGPRAKISNSIEGWRPPKYNDDSFVLRGRWQAKDCGPVVQVGAALVTLV